MGKNLEKVSKQVQETGEIQRGALEKADAAVTDITSVRDILREVPDDVDDDVLSCVEQVSDGATREATDHMNSEVKSELDRGSELGNETADQADDNADRSRRAGSTFGRIAGIRFGEGASDARARAESSAAAFEGQAEEVRKLMEENQSLFDKALADVMG